MRTREEKIKPWGYISPFATETLRDRARCDLTITRKQTHNITLPLYTEEQLREAEHRAEQRVRAEIDHKTVAAIARGYEEMFRVLSHIVGTSGADQAWYRSKAQEALSWVKPLYAISSSTNIAPPGSCQWVSREGNLERILKGRSATDEAREVG